MKKMFLLLFATLLMVACGGKQAKRQRSEGDTLHFKYAQNIVIIKQERAVVVEIKNPWKKDALLHRYVLPSDTSFLPSKVADGVPTTVIPKIKHRAIVCPSTHVALLEIHDFAPRTVLG